MNKYICIHGHFYQPPRENPWLEAIEHQDSAYPYDDWNQRITAECYMPNTASRILNDQGEIIDIVNNYAKMSFNFGPTLLSWMEKHSPRVYGAILKADQLSQKTFSGHGAAIAQAYNHMILPLASEQDKRTQVFWGIRDFEHRFKRKPEGMWLPETAVDTASLEVLADFGIKFTILSPYQAEKVRRVGESEWQDASGGKLDPKIPYLCHLPSGKTITLFFYDGPMSQEAAFGPLLKNGGKFAERLLSVFPDNLDHPRLQHIATDGETYGHHQKFGNMALSYLFDYIDKKKLANITIYAEFLEKFPPDHEVVIKENSSWSCAHGVERWRSDCGCCIGGKEGWNQKWRSPLREAMDELRDKAAPFFEDQMKVYVEDPWSIRNHYIDLLLDKKDQNVEAFFDAHVNKSLTEEERIRFLRLLEMQRNLMLMYTSCGWFFDDVTGIETVQIIQYAARAIQLAKQIDGVDWEKDYLRILQKAQSNVSSVKNGKQIYLGDVKPSVVDLFEVGAHFAISSLFEDYPSQAQIYAYTITTQMYERKEMGKNQLVMGKANVRSNITLHDETINFAVLHLGDHNLCAGVRDHTTDIHFDHIQKELNDLFEQNDVPQVINLISKCFTQQFTLWDLFKNEQGYALEQIMEETLDSIEHHFRQIYEDYYPLMQIKKNVRFPLPKVLSMTVEFILNRDLAEALQQEEIDLPALERLVQEMTRWGFMRDRETLGLTASRTLERLMERLIENPDDVMLVGLIESVLRLLKKLSLPLSLWKIENMYFLIGKGHKSEMEKKAQKNNQAALFWLECFDKLGACLKVKVLGEGN